MTEAEAREIVERYEALVVLLARQPFHRLISDRELVDEHRVVINREMVQLQALHSWGNHEGSGAYYDEFLSFQQNDLSAISLPGQQTHTT